MRVTLGPDGSHFSVFRIFFITTECSEYSVRCFRLNKNEIQWRRPVTVILIPEMRKNHELELLGYIFRVGVGYDDGGVTRNMAVNLDMTRLTDWNSDFLTVIFPILVIGMSCEFFRGMLPVMRGACHLTTRLQMSPEIHHPEAAGPELNRPFIDYTPESE